MANTTMVRVTNDTMYLLRILKAKTNAKTYNSVLHVVLGEKLNKKVSNAPIK